MYAFSAGSKGQDGWQRRMLKAMNGARTISDNFSEFFHKVLTDKMCSRQRKLELCLFTMSSRMRMGDRMDDFMATDEHEGLICLWKRFNKYVVAREWNILNNRTAMEQAVIYYQADADIHKMKKTSARITSNLEEPERGTTLLDKPCLMKSRFDVEQMQLTKSENEERNIERKPCGIISTVEMQQYLWVNKKGARWRWMRRCHGGRAAVPTKLESLASELDGFRKGIIHESELNETRALSDGVMNRQHSVCVVISNDEGVANLSRDRQTFMKNRERVARRCHEQDVRKR